MVKKSISVVIPHFNNLEKLDDCLTALLNQESDEFDLEYIVVDNGSTLSLNVLKKKYSNVTWLLETSVQSPYPCRNKGIQHSRGEIIILLDSNCTPLENFLQQGLKSLAEGNDVIGGQLKFIRTDSLTSRYDQLYSAIRPTNSVVTSLPGTCLFIPRSVFKKVNLFLPCVRSLGDIEWTTRVYKAGFKLSITDQPIAVYQTKEWVSFCRKMIRLGRGKKEIYLNNGRKTSSILWLAKVLKNLLPPNPSFVTRMNKINLSEGTELSISSIIFFCYLAKLLRGFGMITSKTLPPCNPDIFLHK